MLGGSRQAGLGQGAELPRVPQTQALLSAEGVGCRPGWLREHPHGLCVHKPGRMCDLVRGRPGTRAGTRMSLQEPRSQRERPQSVLQSSLREAFVSIWSLSAEPRTWEVQGSRSGGERWCYDLRRRSASQPASQTSKRVPCGAAEQRVVALTSEDWGSPTTTVLTGLPMPQESRGVCCPLVVLPGTAPCPQSP